MRLWGECQAGLAGNSREAERGPAAQMRSASWPCGSPLCWAAGTGSPAHGPKVPCLSLAGGNDRLPWKVASAMRAFYRWPRRRPLGHRPHSQRNRSDGSGAESRSPHERVPGLSAAAASCGASQGGRRVTAPPTRPQGRLALAAVCGQLPGRASAKPSPRGPADVPAVKTKTKATKGGL